jgi:uncharacterized protein YeaO (DUF488 family)
MIKIKRVYDPIDPKDGVRYLVERLWPRGMKKDTLKLDGWLKDVAPSDALRRWFNHDPARWEEFRKRYLTELDGKPDAWRSIIETARQEPVTLLYSTHDVEHNSAVVLKAFLEMRSSSGSPHKRGQS